MTEIERTIIKCDGFQCEEEAIYYAPSGWLIFAREDGDKHLCPWCAFDENKVRRLRRILTMEDIDKRRGD